jgi:hypothetical protein
MTSPLRKSARIELEQMSAGDARLDGILSAATLEAAHR